jgi:hypothetical protein
MYEYSLARSVSLLRSAINIRCYVWVLRIGRVCIQVGTSLMSPTLLYPVSWTFIHSQRSKNTHDVAPWDPLTTRDGVREAARVLGPNANMPGTLSYYHQVSPRFQKEVLTSTPK